MWWSNGFHHEEEVVGSIPVAGLEIDVKLRNLKIRVDILGVGAVRDSSIHCRHFYKPACRYLRTFHDAMFVTRAESLIWCKTFTGD